MKIVVVLSKYSWNRIDFTNELASCDIIWLLDQNQIALFKLIEQAVQLNDLSLSVAVKKISRINGEDWDYKKQGVLFFLEKEGGILFVNKDKFKQIREDEMSDLLSKTEGFFKQLIFCNCDLELLDIGKLFGILSDFYLNYQKALESKSGKRVNHETIFREKVFYKGKAEERKEPEISVVIPAYNSEKYILDSVWSILRQSFPDFEIIVVNEYGGDDHTVKLLHLFEDGRIRIIQNASRLGLAASLNIGIEKARGKYIARMDTDDISKPHRLRLQWEYLESHENIDVLGSAVEVQNGLVCEKYRFPETHHDICAHLIFHLVIAHSTVMFRKEKLLKLGLTYNNQAYGEDYELWTRAMHDVTFANLSDALVTYRIHDSNITRAKQKNLAYETSCIMAEILKRDFNIVVPNYYKKFWNSWINYYNQYQIREKELLDIEKDLLEKMWYQNAVCNRYEKESLKAAIEFRWNWIAGKRSRKRVI